MIYYYSHDLNISQYAPTPRSGREIEREQAKEQHVERERERERESKEEREREREREGKRERERKGGREGERKKGMERGRETEREKEFLASPPGRHLQPCIRYFSRSIFLYLTQNHPLDCSIRYEHPGAPCHHPSPEHPSPLTPPLRSLSICSWLEQSTFLYLYLSLPHTHSFLSLSLFIYICIHIHSYIYMQYIYMH